MRPVLFAVGLLALFAAARLAMILAMYHAPSVMTYLVVMGMGLAAAVIWAGIKAADLSGLFGRMASACALGLVFYVVVEPTTLQPVGPQTATLATILRWGDFVALAAAIVAIRRPVFLMLPSIHVIAGRVMAEHVSGLAVSVHDIIYLAEGGIFCAKVFRGGAENQLLAEMKRRFASVLHVKPPASRPESPELYVLARGFRGAEEQDGD